MYFAYVHMQGNARVAYQMGTQSEARGVAHAYVDWAFL